MSYKKVHLNINKTSVNSTNVECSICLENQNENSSLFTSCNHVFCISCFKKYMISIQEQNLKCPYCRQIIVYINLQNQEEINILRKTFCKTTQSIEFMEPTPEHFRVFDIIHLELIKNQLLDYEFDVNTSIYIFYIIFIICILVIFKLIISLYNFVVIMCHEMVSLY
jgi:hypothetical protein